MVHILRMAEGLKINHDQKDPGGGPGGVWTGEGGVPGELGEGEKEKGEEGKVGQGTTQGEGEESEP